MKKNSSLFYITLILALFLAGCNSGDPAPAEQVPDGSHDTLIAFQPDWEKIHAGEINFSSLLDKPAGGEGFVQLKDGHFYLPSGKRFRIWGVNLTGSACYPEKEDAADVARMLASLGINAVRFHFLDANWGPESSIFRYDTNNTRVFNPVQLEKLDLFVAELKARGIYSNFNLNVGRNFREGDQVPFHQYLGLAKGVTLFDDRIIELQKEHAYNLLTHVNGYTGLEYRNEPALAFVEIVNENSLTEAWFRGHLEGTHNSTQTSTWIDLPAYYAKVLTEKYNRWLEENLTMEELSALRAGAGLTGGEPVPRLRVSEFKDADKKRFFHEAKFIMETEKAFYTGMYRFLKDSVKVNQWVAANSDHNHWKSGYALLSSMEGLDFVDGHVYWQHPRYFTDEKTGKSSFSIENTPMVNDPGMSSVAQLSRSAIAGKPYTVSETNHPYPNQYACEGIPVLAAYALLQDWDGIYFYTFEHADPSEWNSKTTGYFDILHDPVKLSNLATASLMFHRGDIAAAGTTVLRNYTEEDLVEGIRADGTARPFFTPGFDPLTPLVHKTRINSFAGGVNDFPTTEAAGPVTSETSQLQWYKANNEGLVVINSPGTQGLIGYTEKMSEVSTYNMEASLSNPFSSLLLTSMDEKVLENSRKILLTATSSSILSGAVWNSDSTSLEEWGTRPFMIEPVVGTIRLSNLRGGRKLTVTPLDGSGHAMVPFPEVKIRRGKAEFNMGKPASVWYLIELN
ncbi:MAG: hypothetical protein WD578_08210 [Bacteroidales bacterium]